MRLEELAVANQQALDARPWIQPGYRFRSVSGHDPGLHALKRQHAYFGYVEVEVTGVRPFVMASNNDDVVAQVYFWFGPDAYETLSLRVWRRMAREAELVLDVGSYTGLFTLVAAFASPDVELHALEPSPDVFTRLTMNIAVNRLGSRVHLHELAASDEDGTATLHGFQGQLSLSTGSALAAKQGKDVTWSREVRSRRLDNLVDPAGRPTAMKIDAEEAEDRVVRGVTGLLDDTRPRLLVEIGDLPALQACLDALPGYSFAVLDDERHTAHVDDAGILEERTRIMAGEPAAGRRIFPPNVVLWPGDANGLARWLAPLETETTNLDEARRGVGG